MTEIKHALVGYARVSTDDQKLDLQIDALTRYGVPRDRIYTDSASGAKIAGRDGFKHALKVLRPGSVLVVWKIDRLGRNLSELIQTADILRQKETDLVSLTESIDTTSAFGKAMYHIIGVFAQLERDMIVERTKAGLAAARKRGRLPGRRTQMTTEKRADVVEHMRSGLSFEQIAPLVGVSRATLYNHADDIRAELAVIESGELIEQDKSSVQAESK